MNLKTIEIINARLSAVTQSQIDDVHGHIEERKYPGEVEVGVCTEDEIRLFTLARLIAFSELRQVLLRHIQPIIEKLSSGELGEGNLTEFAEEMEAATTSDAEAQRDHNLNHTLTSIFWWEVRERTGQHGAENIGVRTGWRLVTWKNADEKEDDPVALRLTKAGWKRINLSNIEGDPDIGEGGDISAILRDVMAGRRRTGSD